MLNIVKRNKFGTFMVAYSLIVAAFDFAVGSWIWGLIMLAFAVYFAAMVRVDEKRKRRHDARMAQIAAEVEVWNAEMERRRQEHEARMASYRLEGPR